MQYKVPQNIDMADRIVGPLTLVQFLYLLVGGIIVYSLFNIIAPVNFALFVLMAFPVALVALALAFLKIQDQPFGRFIAAFVVYLTRPKMRIWAKDGEPTDIVISPDKHEDKQEVVPKVVKKSQLEHLTQVLDTGGGSPEDTIIKKRMPKVSTPTAAPSHLTKARPVLDNVRKVPVNKE